MGSFEKILIGMVGVAAIATGAVAAVAPPRVSLSPKAVLTLPETSLARTDPARAARARGRGHAGASLTVSTS